MPRNGSGTYTLPAGNPVVAGTTIDASWANDTMNDLANEITNSLSRTGAGGMLAPFRVADGSVSAPGLAFTNETNSGLYRAGSGELWLAIGGVAVAQITANGLLLPAGKRISLPAPVNDADGANKEYVDDAVAPVVQYADLYLGSKTSDPTTNNSGGALVTGVTYWSSTLNQMRVYNGTNWVPMPTISSLVGQTFSGDGSDTTFTLANPTGNAINLEVFISGVRQVPTTDYSVSGTTLTFTTAPPSGTDNIFVRYAQLGTITDGAGSIVYTPAGTGAVATTVQTKLRESVSVRDFGADPTGAVDSTTAIQAGIDAALAAGQRIVAAGTFKTSAKIVIKGDADFSQATFNVYSTPAVAVEVSTGDATDPTTEISNAVIWLPKSINNMTKPATGWAGQGVGVRIVSALECQIFVGKVKDFAIGLLSTSFNTNGTTYNNIYLGYLENNQVNLALTPGDATSWVNENNFIGGRYSHYSAEGTNVAGTRHIDLTPSANSVNNNLFVKPSIEGNTAEYHVSCGGAYNTFQQARWEATTPKLQFYGTSTNHGVRNIVLGGYNTQNIVVSYSGTTGKNNSIVGGAEEAVEMGSSGKPHRYTNVSASASAIRRYYAAGYDIWANGSDWSVSESSQALEGKRATDTYARLKLDYQNGRIYFDNGTTAAPTNYLGSFGANAFASFGVFSPGADNTYTLGQASYRWSVVYAATGTINTSDERAKQDIADLDAAEKRVAFALKGLVKKFRFKDAAAAKGDDARIHIGVIAQEVMAAFQAEGLDPMRYAIVCYDEWDAELDEEGNEVRPAGNRYGVRYEELLAFIIAAL
jgi:hypothetical protein